MITKYVVPTVTFRTTHPGLDKYLRTKIFPHYFQLDAGHNQNHIYNVLRHGYKINDLRGKEVDENQLTSAILYHDLGITGIDSQGRGAHHLLAAKKVRADKCLPQWFSKQEIEEIATACQQHRASFQGKRQLALAKIVADADTMDAFNFERTIVYVNRNWLPKGTVEAKLKLMYDHYLKKFSARGYASFELPQARELTREFRTLLAQIGGGYDTYRTYFLTYYRDWLE
jgi:hypothetical protein